MPELDIEVLAPFLERSACLPHMLDHIKDLSSQLKDKNVLLSRYTKAKPSKDVAPKTQEDAKVDDSASFMDRLNNMKF